MFVKKGDKVRVIAGKDKGTEAVVLTALPKVNKVIVEGVNIVKKHQRPTNELPQGGIIEKEAAIHVSNVQVLDKNGVAGRVGYKFVVNTMASTRPIRKTHSTLSLKLARPGVAATAPPRAAALGSPGVNLIRQTFSMPT